MLAAKWRPASGHVVCSRFTGRGRIALELVIRQDPPAALSITYPCICPCFGNAATSMRNSDCLPIGSAGWQWNWRVAAGVGSIRRASSNRLDRYQKLSLQSRVLKQPPLRRCVVSRQPINDLTSLSRCCAICSCRSSDSLYAWRACISQTTTHKAQREGDGSDRENPFHVTSFMELRLSSHLAQRTSLQIAADELRLRSIRRLSSTI